LFDSWAGMLAAPAFLRWRQAPAACMDPGSMSIKGLPQDLS